MSLEKVIEDLTDAITALTIEYAAHNAVSEAEPYAPSPKAERVKEFQDTQENVDLRRQKLPAVDVHMKDFKLEPKAERVKEFQDASDLLRLKQAAAADLPMTKGLMPDEKPKAKTKTPEPAPEAPAVTRDAIRVLLSELPREVAKALVNKYGANVAKIEESDLAALHADILALDAS